MQYIRRLIERLAEHHWRVELRCNCEETGEEFEEYDWDHFRWRPVAKRLDFTCAFLAMRNRAMREDARWLLRMRNTITREIIPGEAFGL